MEWIDAKDFPQEMTSSVKNMDTALSEIEAVVDQLTAVPLTEAHSSMIPLERSKYDTASVYAVTSLFWAYMKTQGQDPKANGLLKELERVKNVMSRAKQIADKALAPKVDVSAAKRFIRGGLWEPKDADSKEVFNVNEKITNENAMKPPPPKRQKTDPQTSKATEFILDTILFWLKVQLITFSFAAG